MELRLNLVMQDKMLLVINQTNYLVFMIYTNFSKQNFLNVFM